MSGEVRPVTSVDDEELQKNSTKLDLVDRLDTENATYYVLETQLQRSSGVLEQVVAHIDDIFGQLGVDLAQSPEGCVWRG